MPKGISGSGGVDSSALDGLINQLNNILDKQNEINATKVSPKADDKGLKPITKTLEEIRNEAKNTSRTNIELWNTKALKKQIGEAKKILDDSLKSFDISKISSENISGFEKEFLNAFATIKTYSEKYGQEIASEYQNMFDAIFNKSDVFKQDDLQALFQRNINAALSNVKKGSFDIKYEADENWAKEQYKVYEQQAQIAKETANAVKQAERQKQEALMDTRDKILEETKTQLQQIKDMSADNKFLEIDDEQWARFQKSAGDMIQTLSEMGVEVRDLEDIFDSLSKKIYIPKDQFAGLKQGSITENVVGDVSEINKTQQKVEELYNEISRLQNELYNSPTNEAYKDLDKDYEEARIEITALKSEINDLNAELRYSVDFFTWDQKCEEVERLEKAIDELKNKLKSTGGTGGEGLSEEMSKGFNSEELTSFLNVLERIEQQLKNISATLGTVDENSGFNNMISSIDILLSKLDKMRQKIGTGIYNVEIKQGENFGSTSDLLISNERDKLMQSYNKIVKAFGDEEKLFSTMGSVLSRSSGLGSSSDDLFGLFSKDAVASINNPMEQINRIREFLIRFKEVRSELRQEVELLNKDLEYAQDNLKNISNKDEKNDVKNSIKNIKQQLKATSELSQTIDKLSTPSSTNAYLNKKIDSANESEKEFIQKMHEIDSVDLSGVIAQLENIAQILTEISQKDLFGDSLFKVSSQLDEIAAKFDNIVANVKVINEEPILTKNQTPISSNTDNIDKATDAIKEEGEVAEKSASQKEEFANANNKVAESGLETANSIEKATEAIKEEGKAVSEVKIDTNQLENLAKVSDDLKERLGGVVDVYRQVQKDAEGKDKISYRLVGENGSAWVGENGRILKENIKTSEELTQQRKEEKEATRQAVEAERERQSLYKQMQKASSDKQSAQEKQRQSEINALLSEQKNAYQKVWDIRKQIVKLDSDKNTEEISELEKQKQLALEIYAERTKELKSIDEIANSEAQNNTLLQMRQKALNEIAIIEAKLRDRGVVSDQPSPKDDTTKYTNLLARREIQQGNLDAAKIRNDQTAIKYSQERISALNNEIEALEKLGNIDKEVAEQNLKNEIARINASEKVAKAEDAQAKQRTVNLNRQSKMIKDFSLWLSKNGVAAKAYSNEIEIIFNQLQQQGELTAEQLNKVQTEINGIMATAAREGKTGVTFIETLQQRFKSLAAYLASFASFYDVVRYVREGIDIVRQYDTALTEMRKVSDESLSTLKDYASTTFDVGDAVGATALTIQNSTADWMRLGEAINEAQESAKVSNILLNVSEFENIDAATESLVSMSQAYKDLNKMEIVDVMNKVGNEFSISTDQLSMALQQSAAVLQSQGNDLYKSVSLITAGNAITQDYSKTAGMKIACYVWKHMYMNTLLCKVSLKLYATI